jgi:hypothetical protein
MPDRDLVLGGSQWAGHYVLISFKAILALTGAGYHDGDETDQEEAEVIQAVNPAEPETLGKAFVGEARSGKTTGETLKSIGEKWGAPLLTQALVVSIPRNMRVDISVRGDEIKKEDLAKIKSQFDRWIEGLEEAFE